MADMLVSLLNIPDDTKDVRRLNREGILIRRIQPYELSLLRRFVLKHFSEVWADEVLTSFTHQPVTCFVATHEKRIIGFGAYECTRRGFHGVVCGHIHHAEIRRVGAIDYLNCGDWVESCTALIEHLDGRIELYRLAADVSAGQPVEDEPVEAIVETRA